LVADLSAASYVRRLSEGLGRVLRRFQIRLLRRPKPE
jgi:hypothetical protein